ncbi:HD-GYP domain-containing protein [Methylobacterium sp. JK268]
MTSAADPSVVIVTDRPDPARIADLFAPACAPLVLDGAAAGRVLAQRGADLVVIEDGEGLDGIGLVHALRALPHLRATSLMLLADGDLAARRRALEAGATDVVVPPVDGLDLQIRARNLVALSRAQDAAARADGLAQAMERMGAEAKQREREIIHRLMLAAEVRDDQTGDHLTRVAGCVLAIADGLGLPDEEANDIALASTMHDIGKIGVADAVLRKAGPLDEAEKAEMMEHALRGYRMLSDSPSRLLRLAAEIALTHHERWDGTGYPRGLAGEAIPLPGRITAVADVFDALISERVYKPGWPLDRARAFLEEQSGRHFDPACVRAFLSRWDDVVGLVEDRPATRAA